MISVELPNGLRVAAVNKADGAVVYHEIFELNSYAKHGVRLTDGDCVFDVGANIGLYSLFAARQHKGLTIYAFEPIPAVCAALKHNLATHVEGSRVTVFDCGLSDRSGVACFTYDPMASFMSTMRREDFWGARPSDASLRDILLASLADAKHTAALPAPVLAAVDRALGYRVLRPGVLLAAALVLAAVEARQRLFLPTVECALRTASDVIREHGIARIDLLKIDVEGAELDVLRGIAVEHWARIRQVVVEVHDVDGRVNTITALLRSYGFQTTVDQEALALHKAFGIFIVYAVRG